MVQGKPIVFVVVNDDAARDSLELFIEMSGWQPMIFATVREYMLRDRVVAPSCLLLDVSLQELSGPDLPQLVAERNHTPMIFLSKPLDYEVVGSAIRDALIRSHGELGKVVQMRSLQTSYAALSRREREVMALVVSGRLNKQVGCELGISETTVKAHRGKVMRKMRAESLPDLVRMAARLQLSF
jgi:FixJ family two-component response regulator